MPTLNRDFVHGLASQKGDPLSPGSPCLGEHAHKASGAIKKTATALSSPRQFHYTKQEVVMSRYATTR
jgi:hypothetical protein